MTSPQLQTPLRAFSSEGSNDVIISGGSTYNWPLHGMMSSHRPVAALIGAAFALLGCSSNSALPSRQPAGSGGMAGSAGPDARGAESPNGGTGGISSRGGNGGASALADAGSRTSTDATTETRDTSVSNDGRLPGDLPGPRDTGEATDARAPMDVSFPESGQTLPAPPATWKEHWLEHSQELQLIGYNDDVAIYFDADVSRTNTQWILPFMTKLWQYTRQTYGEFGAEGRLYSIHHSGRYSGGHPSVYFDSSHDFRNVSDCGPGPWPPGSIDLPSHEVGHVVEGASRGVKGSPAFGLWGDSKWIELYQYDAYLGMGMTAEAQRLFTRFTNGTDSYPRAGTRWFRDWFYPLWRDHGRTDLMVRYFQLLAQHFPKNGKSYSRDMNWGEFVHFMSGAAQTNLKEMATTAFGWPASWDQQFNKARTDFAGISY